MTLYWAGAEDIDFPLIGGYSVSTTAGDFRSGWSRCGLKPATNTPAISSAAHSYQFTGGALTTAWFSAQIRIAAGTLTTAQMMLGLGLYGTNNVLGVGTDTSNAGKLALFKYDGTTRTQLAAESGTSLAPSTSIRIDMQVVSYGATATVNVYFNGVALITFSGNVAVSGMTNFDSIILMPNATNTTSAVFSEMFVADSDTRAFQGLQSLALTGAGGTTDWTNNTFSNINGISFSDNNPTSVNLTAKDQQYTVTAPAPTSYSVAAISISARMAKTAGATPTQVKLGYKSGGTVAFGTGAAKTLATGYQTFEQIDMVNPVTGVAFTQSDLAALQFDLQSA